MIRYIRLYWMMWLQGIQAQMEYKSSFIIGMIATILGQSTGIAFVWVLFQRIGDLNGWSLPEIMLIYGIAALPYGLFELFFNGIWGLNRYVRMGEFDRLLVRPGSSLFFILGDQPMLHGLGDVAAGIAIIALASRSLSVQWHLGNLLLLGLMVICGTLIYISINTIMGCSSFWFVSSGTNFLYFGQRFRDFTVYPLDIYATPLRLLLTWGIPFAFTGFFPATYFLNHTHYQLFVYLIPVVALLFFGIATIVWRIGLNQYESTGS